MRILTPQELGLPEKYDSWRSNQEEAIYSMVNPTTRVDGLSAPTGHGKTVDIVATAIMVPGRVAIITANRGLQDVYANDFPNVDIQDIRGKSNYACKLKEDYTCEDGYASQCLYKGSVACPYSKAEMKCGLSKIVSSNYDKWTSDKMTSIAFANIKTVIFDEGHQAPEALSRAMQVIIGANEIAEIECELPHGSDIDLFQSWKDWAIKTRPIASLFLKEALAKIESVKVPKQAWVRRYSHLKGLVRRLLTIATALPRDWVVEQIKEGFQFDPIRPGRYGESTLLFNIPRVIFVSATLTEKTLWMTGIRRSNYTFSEFDTTFDPARCPIYYIPTQYVDSKHPDMSKLWMRHDQIATRRRDRKGIVHTISYARRDEIKSKSRYGSSMIINPRGEAPSEIIEDYRRAGPGAILVSPSVGTGYDFPMQQCEWQFVCKIPFPPPSKILTARKEDDKDYYYHVTMQDLVQIFGRGMRSEQDQCESFIGDDNMQWFWKYKRLAPKSFRAFYKPTNVLPAPPWAL